MLLAAGVLALLMARAEGMRFHLPFGDGTVIAGAGIWAGALIVAGLLDRAWVRTCSRSPARRCCFLSGARERAKRPADDVPEDAPRQHTADQAAPPPAPARRGGGGGRDHRAAPRPSSSPTSPTEGEQLHLAPDDREDAQA